MGFTPDPELKFDAYMSTQGKRGSLCDVRIWLPKQPSDDGRVEVTVFDLKPDELMRGKYVTLLSESTSQDFKLTDVFVRSASYEAGRRVNAAQLLVDHIGSFVEKSPGWPADLVSVDSAVFLLSDMCYALPSAVARCNYLGEIERNFLDSSPCLVIFRDFESSCAFKLERHWNWTFDGKKTAVLGRSNPVISFDKSRSVGDVTLPELKECAEDCALLLCLASRRRITVYGVTAFHGHARYTQWSNLLSRVRAQGIEHSECYLVKKQDLESFVHMGSMRMANFSAGQRKVVKSAIFALYSVSQETQEAKFLKNFIAFEGLVRHFIDLTPDVRSGMHSLIKKLMGDYWRGVAGLWPIIGDREMVGLRDLRNLLAHGNNISEDFSNALAIANDHLQLWVEHFIMAILHSSVFINQSNWLQRSVGRQSLEVGEWRRKISRFCLL